MQTLRNVVGGDPPGLRVVSQRGDERTWHVSQVRGMCHWETELSQADESEVPLDSLAKRVSRFGDPNSGVFPVEHLDRGGGVCKGGNMTKEEGQAELKRLRDEFRERVYGEMQRSRVKFVIDGIKAEHSPALPMKNLHDSVRVER